MNNGNLNPDPVHPDLSRLADWVWTSTHNAAQCLPCATAVSSAAGIAQCTGSKGAGYGDDQHHAKVCRNWCYFCLTPTDSGDHTHCADDTGSEPTPEECRAASTSIEANQAAWKINPGDVGPNWWTRS